MLPKQIIVSILLLVSSVVSAPGGDVKNAEEIDGNWLPSAAEFAGNPWPEQIRKVTRLMIKDGTYVVTVGDAPPDRGTVKVDASATPKAMDVTGTEGPNKGKTFPCIYELNGDTLRICYDLSGQNRPTEFKTVAGTKLFLVTYERAKP